MDELKSKKDFEKSYHRFWRISNHLTESYMDILTVLEMHQRVGSEMSLDTIQFLHDYINATLESEGEE